MKAGRRVGSKVRLNRLGQQAYPQWKGKVGRIVKKEILTVGNGLAYGQRARYTISYRVKWEGERRDYLLGADWLQKA